MFGLTQKQIDLAIEDLMAGISAWQLSRLLAWQDIKQRYRRSTLGPIWLTLSSGVQMLTMSMVSALLFKVSIEKSVPYVCAGMLFWVMITQLINDGASLFLNSAQYITQIKCPKTVFVVQAIWRNLIIAAHNSVIYVIIALIFAVVPSPSLILWPLGLLLVMLCMSWMMIICAVISVRYRDVPVIIQNILNVGFWFTPLVYFPDQLGDKRWIVEINPFTHILSLLRDPLLGHAPSLTSWVAVLVMAVVGWVGTFVFFARFRARIIYWL